MSQMIRRRSSKLLYIYVLQDAFYSCVCSTAISSGGRCGEGCGSSTYDNIVLFAFLRVLTFSSSYFTGSLQRLSFSLKGILFYLLILSTLCRIFFSRTYLISSPIIAYYYTQMIGDAKVPPTLLASPGFAGMAVIGNFLL